MGGGLELGLHDVRADLHREVRAALRRVLPLNQRGRAWVDTKAEALTTSALERSTRARPDELPLPLPAVRLASGMRTLDVLALLRRLQAGWVTRCLRYALSISRSLMVIIRDWVAGLIVVVLPTTYCSPLSYC